MPQLITSQPPTHTRSDHRLIYNPHGILSDKSTQEMPVFIVDCDINNLNIDKFIVNLSTKNMKSLGLPNASYVLLSDGKGLKKSICTVAKGKCEENKIFINREVRHNLGLLLGDAVTVERLPAISQATHVLLTSKRKDIGQDILNNLVKRHFPKRHYTLYEGNEIVVRGGNLAVVLVVKQVLPLSYGLTNPKTIYQVDIQDEDEEEMRSLTDLSYCDIGGQRKVLNELRKFECFMKYPSLFKVINPNPARVILHGPEGLGKLLMAKAFANEFGAHFVLIDNKHLKNDADKENNVNGNINIIKEKFNEAIENVPSVLCINDLHLMTPALLTTQFQEKVAATLMESVEKLKNNPNVILIGITTATSKMNHLILTLFLESRNKAEIAFNVPDFYGRLEILKICTRNFTLQSYSSINEISAMTDNYTGAQLAELCGMALTLYMRRLQKECATIQGHLLKYYMFTRCVLSIDEFRVAIDEMSKIKS